MSCKKTNQEIEKQINVEQEFADLRFKDMRSLRYGLSPCCPLEKLEKVTSRKEICSWDDNKLPVYNDKSFIDSTKSGYENYKWLFENSVIPDWVQKVCTPCDPISSTVITTTSFMTLHIDTSVIDADVKLIRDTTKIYLLAKYDGTISANQTSTYFTVGYGVVPAVTLDMNIIVYGNTNTADPKNGADASEVLTIIIDVNGDGSELLQIESTSITGWNPNTYQVSTTKTIGNSSGLGTKAAWCTFGISTDCTFCGEASTPDPGDQECIDDAECVVIYVKDIAGNAIDCYPIYIDNREVGMTDENGFYVHTEYHASTNKNHSIDICHCFTTTGGCAQQRIDITVTPEITKVVCTPLTVDCTPET
tara:strand:+ start:950 stop:2038 length:1089 start_codon:yes stop_codon:yes gene_type:complete